MSKQILTILASGLVVLFMGLAGCAAPEAVEAQLSEDSAALKSTFAHRGENPWFVRDEMADRCSALAGDEAHDGECKTHCDGRASCVLVCEPSGGRIDGDGFAIVARFEDPCIVCGRETGFLPQPDLEFEGLTGKTVTLAWDAVEGADSYVLHQIRWVRDDGVRHPVDSREWSTSALALQVELQEGFGYTFFLVAFDTEGKRRSRASAFLMLEL